jgi:molybdopterin/thiamine biosynthesis adenylyltransferase
MNNETQQRFKDLSWFDTDYDLTIGGAGGIGSWTAFLLGRIGYRLFIYDFDNIERHNLGGQLFNLNQVNMNKVDALAQNIKDFSENIDVQAINQKLDENSIISDYCFSCFDNMEARKIMFEKWKSSDTRKIFIDGRMNCEQFQIFTVIPGREEEYEKSLFDDSEVEEQLCTMKATSHCAATIAGFMTSIFTNYIANEKQGMVYRNVPFYTALQLQILNLEFEQ